ncbi:hypothetical protein Sjap_003465 [Stephania japonica]|uniref:non-specific serine/threonine protein kinase n=1 Tax=Stephania japonica TaxID=461633 RepID=A0AAP0KRG1_9MAGN
MDWSGGCRRRTGLNCSNGVGDDGFVRFSSVKVPDTTFTWVNMSMGLVECQMKCLKNCSCMAYANTDVRGSGSGCVLWFGDLIDLREFTAGGGGQDLYVRMAASELDAQQGGSKKKKNRAVAAVVSISVITGVLLVASVIWCFIARTRMMQRENINQEEESTRDLELPLLDFVTVANATNNFSYDKLIGEGGFGPVYKGILQNGQEIAVKRLSKNSGQGLREFKNEVILISKLQHRNLVRLLGCCIQRDEMMLIYEYMPNKSLDNFIFDKVRSKSLSWEKRFDIIIGIAQGLLYLHRDSRLRIIHRDLKAANILLDREMNPKISDFGLARTFGGDETQANTRRVVGTYGYMSPEYAADGLFSMKSDVFSFGVLVLEIVSGKRNKGFYLADHDFNLLGHAWNLWNEDRAMELVDEMFTNQDVSSRFVVFRCIQVGLLCVQQRPDDRPTMPTVVMMLGSESTYLPEPKHPGFYYERSFMDEGQSSSDKFSYGNKERLVQTTDRQTKIETKQRIEVERFVNLSMAGTALLVFFISAHTLLSLFLFHISSLAIATATDSLTINQALTFNQTLISSNQNFKLGFFTPTNSNNNNNDRWYLGIWFNKIPIRTYVWIANRDDPLHSSSSPALKLNNNGLLTLVNETNHVIWSSSSLNTSNRAHSPVFALLLDNGNLVIKSQTSTDDDGGDDSNGYVWQSFDYPSENLINGMKFGWNLKTGLNRNLRSWKSSDDPSNGDFVYEMDRRGFPELVFRKGSVNLYRTGPWTGIQFSGTPELKSNPVFEPSFLHTDEEVYYSFRLKGSVVSILRLDSTGSLNRITWNDRSLQWVVMLSVMKDLCNKYGLCGVHGVCNIDDTVPCKCLKGFVPTSPQNWSRVDWSDGCRRRVGLNCTNGVGDDGFQKLSFVKVPDTTFAWVNMSMGLSECQMKCLKNCSCTAFANADVRGSGSGCVLWFGDLIDLREFTAGGGQDLYVRMAASELEAQQDGFNKKKKRAVVVASVSVVTGILLVASIVWCFILSTRRRQRGEGSINQEQDSTRELELPLFDFVTVATATNNFSNNKVIGEGGFGPVYKGILPNGQEIAVKRLSENSGQGLREFKNEVILISKLQHRNLVKVLGCCIQREEMMLVYEYMPNKSLDNFIFDGLFSMKSDVFSFGVLTLEIVSGKRNKGFYLAGYDFNLLGHAWNLWNEDRALELVDEVFTVDVSSRSAVLRCIQVGLLCVQQRLDDRPTMPSVVMMLGSESANLPQPKQPGFYYERSSTDEGPSSSEKFSHGKNLSFTQLEGR